MDRDLWSKLDRMHKLSFLLTGTLTGMLVFIFRPGWMVDGFVFAVGTISYMLGINEQQGKKTLFSGFLLFIIFLYLERGVWIDLFG